MTRFLINWNREWGNGLLNGQLIIHFSGLRSCLDRLIKEKSYTKKTWDLSPRSWSNENHRLLEPEGILEVISFIQLCHFNVRELTLRGLRDSAKVLQLMLELGLLPCSLFCWLMLGKPRRKNSCDTPVFHGLFPRIAFCGGLLWGFWISLTGPPL